MTTRPLDRLSPESRAVLSLILLQSRSYADIAALLRLPEDDVRERAHTAASGLVESNAPPAPDLQAQVIDYVLGEQTVSEREQTRSTLQADPVAREWAALLVNGLSPLARTELPAIPGAPAEEHEPLPADEDETEAPAEPVQPLVVTAPPAAEPPAPEPPTPQRNGRRTRLLAAALGALVIVVVIVIVAIASGGGGSHKTAPGAGNTVAKVVLTPTASGAGAGGAATVERHDGGLLLELSAHGLAPNTASNSYGVWLYSTPSDAVLLGFVSPPVGHSDAFKNGAALPKDASRFHTLIVTVETVEQPSKPGPIVLRAALSLP